MILVLDSMVCVALLVLHRSIEMRLAEPSTKKYFPLESLTFVEQHISQIRQWTENAGTNFERLDQLFQKQAADLDPQAAFLSFERYVESGLTLFRELNNTHLIEYEKLLPPMVDALRFILHDISAFILRIGTLLTRFDDYLTRINYQDGDAITIDLSHKLASPPSLDEFDLVLQHYVAEYNDQQNVKRQQSEHNKCSSGLWGFVLGMMTLSFFDDD